MLLNANVWWGRGVSYDDLKTNNPICESYVSVMRAMGHHTVMNNAGQSGKLTGASTDMGMSILTLLHTILSESG